MRSSLQRSYSGRSLVNDHSSFGAGYVFGRIERISDYVVEAADISAPIARAVGLRSVPDDLQLVAPGKLINSAHVARVAEQMHWRNRSRARGNLPDRIIEAEGKALLVNIAQHRRATGEVHRARSRDMSKTGTSASSPACSSARYAMSKAAVPELTAMA